MQMHELHSDIEFKYVKVRKDGHVGQWERGHNRNFSLENPPAKDVFVDGGQFGDEQAYDHEACREVFQPGAGLRGARSFLPQNSGSVGRGNAERG